MENEERFKRIEKAVLIMQELVVSHDDRLENFLSALDRERQEREENNKDFNFKLNALIDAQLRNESGITQLKEASESQLKRIENLENK